MSKSARVQEPSMEEILASIRRIIADEGGLPPKPEPPAARADDKAQAEEADVLELTQPVEEPPGFTAVQAADVVFREEPEADEPEAPDDDAASEPAGPVDELPPPAAPARAETYQPKPAPARGPLMRDQELMSPTATAAVSAAFGSLAHTILSENSRTLEDLVKEMMRPMLKEWLDDNLPGLVERLVRAEIERVARGGR